jgi:hypothetical protein
VGETASLKWKKRGSGWLNLIEALNYPGRGLSKRLLSKNYQGTAIYCEWETSDSEWAYFREHFLKRAP